MWFYPRRLVPTKTNRAQKYLLSRGRGAANTPPSSGRLGQELIVLRAVHPLHLPHIRLNKKTKRRREQQGKKKKRTRTQEEEKESRWEDPTYPFGVYVRTYVRTDSRQRKVFQLARLSVNSLAFKTLPQPLVENCNFTTITGDHS